MKGGLTPSRFSNTFFLVLMLRLFDSYHCRVLVGMDVVEGKRNAEPESSAKINRTAQELASFGMLRGVQAVEWAFVATRSIVARIRAETNVTEIVPPQRPIYEEAQRGPVRPLRS